MRPSSDTPTHVRLYRQFDGVGGIAHTHSRHATMFAQARERSRASARRTPTISSAPCRTRPLTAAEVEADYEGNTGQVIVERFAGLEPLAMPAVLVAGHAPFTWGQTRRVGEKRRWRWRRSPRWPWARGSLTRRRRCWKTTCWTNTTSGNTGRMPITDRNKVNTSGAIQDDRPEATRSLVCDRQPAFYGDETLKQVAEHSQIIARSLADSAEMPVKVVFKPVLTTPQAITDSAWRRIRQELRRADRLDAHLLAGQDVDRGLADLRKPFVHLHTQFNREIPWSTIDMDFMNLNQSAHGCREFGFICSRMRLRAKWWSGIGRTPRCGAAGRLGPSGLCLARRSGGQVARFGDNMREVAVTEGDKVEAQLRLGYSVNGYGVGDLVGYIDGVTDADIDRLVAEYDASMTSRRRCGPAATRARPARARGSKRACGPFCRPAISKPSPTRSRTCTDCISCRAWPSSG